MSRPLALLILLSLVAPSLPAAAAGQKPGQWLVTSRMTMKGIPEEQLAQMRKMGMGGIFSGEPRTTKQCVTPEQAAKGIDFDQGRNGCQYANKVVTATRVSADVVCPGPRLKGKGHIDMTLSGDSAYSGRWSLDGVDRAGNKLQQEIQFDGKWDKASCDADALGGKPR